MRSRDPCDALPPAVATVAFAVVGMCSLVALMLAVADPCPLTVGASVFLCLATLALGYWRSTEAHERRAHLETMMRWPAPMVVYAPVSTMPADAEEALVPPAEPSAAERQVPADKL